MNDQYPLTFWEAVNQSVSVAKQNHVLPNTNTNQIYKKVPVFLILPLIRNGNENDNGLSVQHSNLLILLSSPHATPVQNIIHA